MKSLESLKEFEIKNTLKANKVLGGEDPGGSYGQMATYVDGIYWGSDGEEYTIELPPSY